MSGVFYLPPIVSGLTAQTVSWMELDDSVLLIRLKTGQMVESGAEGTGDKWRFEC